MAVYTLHSGIDHSSYCNGRERLLKVSKRMRFNAHNTKRKFEKSAMFRCGYQMVN
jgi:hypothetical protein